VLCEARSQLCTGERLRPDRVAQRVGTVFAEAHIVEEIGPIHFKKISSVNTREWSETVVGRTRSGGCSELV
jgi:hypothetical protein